MPLQRVARSNAQQVPANATRTKPRTDTGQRLAALLVDLAVRHGRDTADGIEIGIALSQDEISGMIGASRDSVIRALASMRSRGLVVTGRRSMTVRDLDALGAYATSERSVS
jgi:CRP-like cAMP-binding protein